MSGENCNCNDIFVLRVGKGTVMSSALRRLRGILSVNVLMRHQAMGVYVCISVNETSGKGRF
jgi:hypothetical protein